MSFRSGINQQVVPNSAVINTFAFTIPSVVSGAGGRSSLPITLGAGTYKCSLSYQINITGTGSIILTNLNTGLSSATFSNPIAPLPLSATSSIQFFTTLGQVFNAGTGFSDFKDTYISLSQTSTIYLYNQMSYVLNAGSPVVGITQTVTFTPIS